MMSLGNFGSKSVVRMTIKRYDLLYGVRGLDIRWWLMVSSCGGSGGTALWRRWLLLMTQVNSVAGLVHGSGLVIIKAASIMAKHSFGRADWNDAALGSAATSPHDLQLSCDLSPSTLSDSLSLPASWLFFSASSSSTTDRLWRLPLSS